MNAPRGHVHVYSKLMPHLTTRTSFLPSFNNLLKINRNIHKNTYNKINQPTFKHSNDTTINNNFFFKLTTMAKNNNIINQSGETSQPIQRHTNPSESSSLVRRTSGVNPDADVPLRRRHDPFLIVCRCFSLITAISAILCIAVNVLSAVRSFKNGSDVFDGIFRCYAVAIAVFTVVAETEWNVVFKFWKVLEYWAGRGMLQIFVAVMTRAFPDYSGQRKDLVLLQNIASYLLLSCGVVYLISGILCIGFLKRKLEQKATTRDQAVKDLEELERRKNELEALLIDNTV